MPQASLEPLSTAVALVLPLPLASSDTVTSWQVAVGGVLSSTVMVAEQVAEFALLSVTVSVTALAPTLAHVKLVVLKTSEASPQGSPLLFSTAAAVVEPLPAASRDTVIFWHRAFGGVVEERVVCPEAG